MPAGWAGLLLMLIGIGVLTCAVSVLLMAWWLMHPPRMTDGKALWVLRRLSPSDLGLIYQDVSFRVRDERGNPLRIAAWWIAASGRSERCAVLIHGYADAKVGAIAWAPLWHELGFNLLVPDLRAHGESEGRVCTAGFHEREDLAQVLDELRATRPEETRQLVLTGMSMGGAVASATAVGRSDIAAVVMESPYADFPSAAAAHMNHLGLPGGFLQRWGIRAAQWLSYCDYAQVAPAELIPKLTCPVLLIVSGNDSFLSAGARQCLQAAVERRRASAGTAELWVIDGVEHLMALCADPQEYRQRLRAFLARNVADRCELSNKDEAADASTAMKMN